MNGLGMTRAGGGIVQRLSRINWLTVAEVIYICVLIYAMVGRNDVPFAMRLWNVIYRVCYTSARVAGTAGLYAEKAYWAAAERARG